MGVVWRARDQILDREVAVKEVVISSLLGEEERRNAYQRTLREARTAARLSHRGLVAVYDVAEEDGRPWIVMELVPSRSLDQVLTVEGRLPAARVARVGQQLLSALAAAHLAGVLHRDVKPSNVLIATDRTGTGWDERAVLTDFGIAQFEGDPRLTQTGMVMGSPGFTAPERIRGGDATPASDLWSLGATLYAAVEGRGPYEQRGGAITTMSAIINEDAPIAAHAGRLAQVIAALLRREPSARPSAPTASRMFAQVLSQLATSENASSAAHPPTVISKRVPPSAAPAAETEASSSEAPARPTPAAAEPSPAASKPEAVTPEAVTPEAKAPAAAADEAEATEEAAKTPAPDAQADAEATADDDAAETPADADSAAADADERHAEEPAAQEPPAQELAEVKPAVEPVSAVEAVSAIEPLETPDDIEDADVPAATAEVVDAAATAEVVDAGATELVSTGEPDDVDEPVKAGAEQSGPPSSAADHGAAGDGLSERPTPAARTATPKPKPSPSFTAAKPGERSATPTFSAARPASSTGGPAARPASTAPLSGYSSAPPKSSAAQPGAAQPGAAQSGANLYGAPSYSGPSGQQPGGTTPYLDQSIQYPLGSGGGRAQRRSRPKWRLIVVIVAVLVAVAVGAGAAIALGDHGSAKTTGTQGGDVAQTTTKTPYKSVNALNHPSSVAPAGWVPESVQPSANNTNAGFTLSVPPGWTKQRKGLGTFFHGPSDMLLEIDLTPHKFPNNMIREAMSVERGAKASGDFPQYRRAALAEVPVRGTKGAFLQYTWSLDGALARSDDILFVLPTSDGSQSYAVYIRGLSSEWNTTDLPLFDQILSTFQTVPAAT